MSNQDMVDGYLDGLSDTRISLPALTNRGAAYVHGWENGRDDRTCQPRDSADKLRRKAAALTNPKGDG